MPSRPRLSTVVPLCAAAALVLAPGFARGQGSASDYERAARLPDLVRDKVFRARVQPHWFARGSRFWYRNDLPDGHREFVLVDAVAGKREPAFDHVRLAGALRRALGAAAQADRLPIEWLEFRDDGSGARVYAGGKTFECDLRRYEARELPGAEPPIPSLPVLDAPHPSLRTGEETSIAFLNRTQAEVKLFWLDSEGQRRPYGSIQPGAQRTQHTFAGHVWALTDAAGTTLAAFEATDTPGTAVVGGRPPARTADQGAARPSQRQPRGARPQADPALSPDGRWRAAARDGNVWLRDARTGEETQLTRDGTRDDAYSGEFAWSPDGSHLVALRTKAGQEHKVYLVESSPADQLQPKLHTLDYLKPGDQIPLTKPHLFDIARRREVPISDALFPNPWSISDVHWAPDSREFTFLYNQRGHQVLRIVAVDAATGEARAIVDERSKTFIDYAGKYFAQYLETRTGGELLWMSERDGWNHLYLYDARTGKVRSQVTKGPWVVRGVDRVDAERRQVWFRAGGIHPGRDPYYVDYCRANLDGTGLTVLTQGNGTHTVGYSPDERFYLDTYSRVDLPPVTELHRTADGTMVCALEKADAGPLLATGWKTPEPFVAKGRDGATDIYGVIIRPTSFDPARSYPVVECIYAGPQASYVPKGWSNYHGMQEIAELGFIVVQIDGMGTSNRSKAFHDVCWRNLADAGLPDRILWLKAAARRYPYMDLARVGIYGGSAGGQNALAALLWHPEFYKAAVADCGCHDNRMDKVWWNELWMGWPVGPQYAACSNVTNAHRLQGKLLLIVGELDSNVDPASTMQVVNALVKANKDFDLLVVPGANHGAAETPYGRRRRQDFFVRSLLGVEPRHLP